MTRPAVRRVTGRPVWARRARTFVVRLTTVGTMRTAGRVIARRRKIRVRIAAPRLMCGMIAEERSAVGRCDCVGGRSADHCLGLGLGLGLCCCGGHELGQRLLARGRGGLSLPFRLFLALVLALALALVLELALVLALEDRGCSPAERAANRPADGGADDRCGDARNAPQHRRGAAQEPAYTAEELFPLVLPLVLLFVLLLELALPEEASDNAAERSEKLFTFLFGLPLALGLHLPLALELGLLLGLELALIHAHRVTSRPGKSGQR